MKMKIIAGILIILFLAGCGDSPDSIWRIERVGTIERIEYIQSTFSRSAQTIFYFTDGSTYIVWGIKSIPGKELIIERNQFGTLRLRKRSK